MEEEHACACVCVCVYMCVDRTEGGDPSWDPCEHVCRCPSLWLSVDAGVKCGDAAACVPPDMGGSFISISAICN